MGAYCGISEEGFLLLVDRVTGLVPAQEVSWKRGAKVEDLYK